MSEDKRYRTPSRIWLLASDVTVVEAVLLLLEIEPQEVADEIERWAEENQPPNYRAAKQAIVSALLNGETLGHLQALDGAFIEVGASVPFYAVDVAASKVNFYSFREWVEERGYQNEFLALPKRLADVSDPDHPRYAPKLAAAIAAWESFSEIEGAVGTVKQRIEKWLRLNAARFDLVDDEGNPQETVIQQIAKVANWSTAGGAPPMDQREIAPD